MPNGILRLAFGIKDCQNQTHLFLLLTALGLGFLHGLGADHLMAIAARKVLEGVSDVTERERWMSCPFTGSDGLEKTGQTWVRDGLLTATVVMPLSAPHALKLMLDSVGKPGQVQERNWLTPESFPPLNHLRPVVSSSL